MLKIIKEAKKPKILIITPLLTGHTISNGTKTSIKRNDGTLYTWISYEGQRKHAANVQAGLEAYTKMPLPTYMMILDRDIILGRHCIDRMFECIEGTPDNIGFVFSPFEYKGFVNATFGPLEYNINRLLVANYISSNSLYKLEAVRKVGFVTEERYHRLSDWAMWLKMFKAGYIGKLCPNAFFTAISNKDDISAGSMEEYTTTKKEVFETFIKPILTTP
jgi:hypothetical protein